MKASTFIAVLFYSFQAYSQKINAPEQLKNHVLKLCSTTKPRNFKNLESLEEAGNYIIKTLTDYGYEPEKQIYSVDSNNYFNVIGRYGDTLLPRFVIGAHYDVCGEQQGADDNASGVAGLLELAHLLKIEKPKINFCIELVFFTLEEPPFFRTEKMGSFIHAKSLYESKKKCVGMISLEMIGYFSEQKKSQGYPINLLRLFYPSKGNFIALVSKKGNKKITQKFKKGISKNAPIKTKKLIAPTKLQGIDFSDHLNYWKFGFKAFMITDTAFLRNKNYHKKSDTPNTLNYEKMAEVINGLYKSLIQLNV